jgi:hypothetical protein
MTRLSWGSGQDPYEQGVDRGVLYLPDAVVPWIGLTSVSELDDGNIDTTHYFDGKRYRFSQNVGNFGARIEAFTYPEEFEPYDGLVEEYTGQPRAPFSFSWRVQSGDGHKIHLVYGVTAKPSSVTRSSLSADVEPATFAWDISTTPVHLPGAMPGSHLVIDSNQAYAEAFAQFEAMLYGTDTTDPQIPSPEAVAELFDAYSTLRITYLGDGIWKADGPDELIDVLSTGVFYIDSPSAFYLDEYTYMISSF